MLVGCSEGGDIGNNAHVLQWDLEEVKHPWG